MRPFVETRICLQRTFPPGVAQRIDAFRYAPAGNLGLSLRALQQSGTAISDNLRLRILRPCTGVFVLRQCQECHELTSFYVREGRFGGGHRYRCKCKRTAAAPSC